MAEHPDGKLGGSRQNVGVAGELGQVHIARGRRWADHRGTLEAIAWKYRANSPWRDTPEELGSFQTAHKRLIRWAVDGTWEKIFAAVLAAADAVDDIGWTVVLTNRTDTSDQLTDPSKRHALAVFAGRRKVRDGCGLGGVLAYGESPHECTFEADSTVTSCSRSSGVPLSACSRTQIKMRSSGVAGR
ncbi:transposase [Streptomyces canus]|nr:transposase [Streptomyces canus]MDQ1073790.1 transposase [Streptomyces canus]